jgi:transcriptional regulator with XRE-family HTH domain
MILSVSTPPPAFATRLRTIRQARGLTRAALAARAGLSAVYVRKLEAGERRWPSVAVLERIARALGVALVIDLVPARQGRRRRN